MTTCKTSVQVTRRGTADFSFVNCGKPATESVYVGAILCRYCPAHAAAARGFVTKTGADKIAGIQRSMGVAP